jgi:hypothetical protein
MRTAPSPPEKGHAGTQSHPRRPRPADSDQNHPPITDPWIRARSNYLSAECSRLAAGLIARRFLTEARARYRQYTGCGCPRLSFLAWSALDIVAGQLVGRRGERVPSQEELNDNKRLWAGAKMSASDLRSAMVLLPADQNAAEATSLAPLAAGAQGSRAYRA